jgi:hypothetical protein
MDWVRRLAPAGTQRRLRPQEGKGWGHLHPKLWGLVNLQFSRAMSTQVTRVYDSCEPPDSADPGFSSCESDIGHKIHTFYFELHVHLYAAFS